MLAVREKFEKRMKLLLSHWTRTGNLYSSFHPDVVSLIYRYIPGKDGSLILKQNQIRDLRSDVQYEFDNVHIPFGSHLRVKKWDSNREEGGRLIIHCFDLVFIQNGGSIDISKSGYLGGRAPLCCGESYDHCGSKEKGLRSGNGAGGGGICGGGGSYGSAGKDGFRAQRESQSDVIRIENANLFDVWNLDNNDNIRAENVHNDAGNPDMGIAGQVYGDDNISELYLGSGGGASFRCGAGRGGGALLLITNSLVNKGRIECNGADAKEWGSGGGSGGSIVIDILGEKECIIGVVEAKGGIGARMHGFMRSDKGGDGGNGRVCIVVKQHAHYTIDLEKVKPRPSFSFEPRLDGSKYCV